MINVTLSTDKHDDCDGCGRANGRTTGPGSGCSLPRTTATRLGEAFHAIEEYLADYRNQGIVEKIFHVGIGNRQLVQQSRLCEDCLAELSSHVIVALENSKKRD